MAQASSLCGSEPPSSSAGGGLAQTPESPAERGEQSEVVCGPASLRGAADWVACKSLALQPLDPSLSLSLPLALGRRILWDTGYLLTAPARWDGCDWGTFSLFGVATGAALGLDEPIDTVSRVKNPRSDTEADVENALEKFAELPGIAGVIGGAYLLGVFTGSDTPKRAALDMGEALLVSEFVFVEPLKLMTGRERPSAGNGPYDWFSGGKSFPSSHTSTAFVLATGVSMYTHDNLWVAIPAYTLATGVAFSRIRANQHFLSDVVVGAAIGIATTRTVIGLERQRLERQQATAPQLTLAPFVAPEARGLQLVVRF